MEPPIEKQDENLDTKVMNKNLQASNKMTLNEKLILCGIASLLLFAWILIINL